MDVKIPTKITQILEITNTDKEGNEIKQYMIEKENEWITINESEYQKFLRGK